MSESKPCPICGDDDEFLRFLDLTAKHANEIWRRDEVKTLEGIYKEIDFVQVVRCRDCKYCATITVSYSDKPAHECIAEWCRGAEGDNPLVEPDGFCAWGERK